MNSYTARFATSGAVFLLLYSWMSSFDIALTGAAATALLLIRAPYHPVLIVSICLFLFAVVTDEYDILLPFVSDLQLDAYLLFVCGVFLVVRARYTDRFSLPPALRENSRYWQKRALLPFLGGLTVGLLLFPILGQYGAALAGYGVFSYLIQTFSGKPAVAISLVWLVGVAIALLIGQPLQAEALGRYVYLFLAVGVAQEIVRAARRSFDPQSLVSGRPALPRFSRAVIIGGCIGMLIGISVGILLLAPIGGKRTASVSAVPTPSQTRLVPSSTESALPPSGQVEPTPSLTVPAVPAQEQVRIMVRNGTDIQGLAASTAAILRNTGFTQVEIENAQSDYEQWEAVVSTTASRLTDRIKTLLGLQTLTVHEATGTAEFDIILYAGKTR